MTESKGIEVVQDTGYGLIPKKITRNKHISIQAKGLYSYLASFAGNTGEAFPSVSLMLGELDISRDTFYRYMNELREVGAVEVKKARTGGKFARNVYLLNNQVNPPCPKSSDTVNSTTVSSDTVSSTTVSSDTISNSSISNNLISNSNKNNSKGVEEEVVLNSKDTEFIIEEWNKLELQQLRTLNHNTKRYKSLKSRIDEYSFDEVIEAIRNINNSSFLQGHNDRGWTITFDWLVRPNNFVKVLEGNYVDKKNTVKGVSGNAGDTKEVQSESQRLREIAIKEGLIGEDGSIEDIGEIDF